jgi:hypothetical protein
MMPIVSHASASVSQVIASSGHSLVRLPPHR